MTDPNRPDDQPPTAESSADATSETAARKPRRRRTVRPESADGAVTEGGSAPLAAQSEPTAREHASVQGGEARESFSTSSSDRSAPRESSDGEAPGEPGARSGESAGEGAGDGAGEGTGEGRRKRHRNRRRNRRGGARAAEGAVGADGQPQAEESEAVADVTPPANLPVTDVNALFADLVSGAYDAAIESQVDAVAPVTEGNPSPEAASASEDGLPSASQTGAATSFPADEVASDTASEMGAGGEGPSTEASMQRAQPSRRVLAPEPEAPKLQKVLAQSGVGSRRDLEQMIAGGRIVVNGQPAHVGQRIKMGDRITLDGKPVRVRITPSAPRVLAYHKPVGEVVTHDDPQARPTVFRRLPRLQHGKWQSVGRLDINTEGLLLFTNSGDLANRLMHPRFGVEREYAVRVLGTLTDDEREQLLQGVTIEGQPASFRSIADGGGEGVNHWYRVVITEGRNREVRKLFDSVNKAVSRLIRIRYGSVVLPRGLKRGVWVDLGFEDLRLLQEASGMPARRAQGPREGRGPAAEEERRTGRRNGRGRDGRRGEPGAPAQGARRPQNAVPDFDDDENLDNIGPIPDPLQQTYDRRAFQQSKQRVREYGEDGPIPNPLQQTYDKRAIQSERRPQREFSEDGPIPNPLQQTYDKRFASSSKPGGGKAGGGAGGGRRKAPGNAPRKASAGGQPDPMRTAVGYIGGDAFHNKQRGSGRGGPKSGGKPGGGGRGRGGGGGGGGKGR